MKKREPQKERLDQLGLRILEACRLEHDDIENIVAAPHLFSSIKFRIKAEEPDRKMRVLPAAEAILSTWRLQKIGLAFAVSVLLMVGAVGWLQFTKKDSSIVAQKTQSQMPSVEIPQAPEIDMAVPEMQETQNVPVNDQATVQHAVLHDKRASKSHASKHSTDTEEMGEFYALTYAGGPDVTDDGEQIVRVELPRSSLFAMGIDVPVENIAPKIKTDLLITADGMMRAVRFVK